MARQHARINFDIWSDPDFLALPWPAQHVYLMLWSDPGLSYCGVADFRPGRIVQRGQGWQLDDFNAIADCLRARHFIVVDEITEECLIRSWIKFDAIFRHAKMAVSMANAWRTVTSPTLRGVIVHEMNKAAQAEPDAAAWDRPAVKAILEREQVDAKSLTVPSDPFRDGLAVHLASISASPKSPFSLSGPESQGETFQNPSATATGTATTYAQNRLDTDSSNDDWSKTSAPDEPAREAEDDRFDEFWNVYDKKVGKKNARAKWRLALRKKGVTADLLIEAAASYVAWVKSEGKHPAFTKDPATWLNGEHWNDERVSRVAESSPELTEPTIYVTEQPPDGLSPAEYREWWAGAYERAKAATEAKERERAVRRGGDS